MIQTDGALDARGNTYFSLKRSFLPHSHHLQALANLDGLPGWPQKSEHISVLSDTADHRASIESLSSQTCSGAAFCTPHPYPLITSLTVLVSAV